MWNPVSAGSAELANGPCKLFEVKRSRSPLAQLPRALVPVALTRVGLKMGMAAGSNRFSPPDTPQ